MIIGQAPESLTPGQQVRVVARCDLGHDQVTRCRDDGAIWTYTGQLESLDDDKLRIRMPSSGVEIVIPRNRVARAWVADGKHYNGWSGAGMGAAAGLMAGLVSGG